VTALAPLCRHARRVGVAALLALGACATGRGGSSAGNETAAEACFVAASQRRATADGERKCSAALASPALPPGLRAATLVNRGIIALDAGRIDGAVDDFDAAIALAPDNADAHINKGVALVRLEGREKEAVAVLTRALDLEPRRPELAYYHRAIANEALGKLRAAYEDYAIAAQLAPDWPEPAQQLQRFKVIRRKTLTG
jgi:tetratricopeptide (TPR) repeat protein